MAVFQLSDASARNEGEADGVRVDDGVEGKIELLRRRKRHRLAAYDDIEQRQYTPGSLLLLLLHLALSLLPPLPVSPLRIRLVRRGSSALLGRHRLLQQGRGRVRKRRSRTAVVQGIGRCRTREHYGGLCGKGDNGRREQRCE